jgi:flagellar capping protein FliD
VTLAGQSTETVTVNVSQSDSSLVTMVQLFVDSYNKLRDKLESQTFYNEADKSTGVLFGTNEALRVDTELSGLLSGRFFGAGSIQSLKELGIDITEEGKLTLDTEKLKEKFAADPETVKEFFTKDKVGFADKVDNLVETFTGVNNSLLVSRAAALQRRIDVNNERIDNWNVRLERAKEALLKKFYNLENALGKLQNSLSAVNSIQALPPLGTY